MTKAYRIVKPRFAETAFDGEGSRLFGGRWNRRGTRMVYTSASASLAVLETFIHLGIDAKTMPHTLIEINIPENIIEIADDLPENWDTNPVPESCQDLGTVWVDSMRSAVLVVPSVIMAIEHNYLINPAHPDFKRITIDEGIPFAFDESMWKTSSNEKDE